MAANIAWESEIKPEKLLKQQLGKKKIKLKIIIYSFENRVDLHL